jgi:anti-sigma factor RsiW
MNCTSVRNLLSAYLDSELPGSEMQQVRAHLEGCAACRAECDGLREVKSLLRRLPPCCAPEGMEQRLKAALRQAERPLPVRVEPTVATGLTLAAAAAIAGFFVYTLMRPAAEPTMAGDYPPALHRQIDGTRDFERARSPFSGHTIPASLDDGHSSR